MLYFLSQLGLDPESSLSPFRLFRYVSFRAGGAAFSAFVLTAVFGPFTVKLLKHFKCVTPNRLAGLVEVDPGTLKRKENVPSMGGLLILGAVVISILLWAIPTNSLVIIFLGLLILLGFVGFIDDYLKVTGKSSRDGLPAKWKFLAQIIIAVMAVWALDKMPETEGISRSLWLPFTKRPVIESPSISIIRAAS